MFWEHFGNRDVRSGKEKLVEDKKQGRWELYDMEKDRTELHDLSGDMPEKVEELMTVYNKWRRTSGCNQSEERICG